MTAERSCFLVGYTLELPFGRPTRGRFVITACSRLEAHFRALELAGEIWRNGVAVVDEPDDIQLDHPAKEHREAEDVP